MTIDESTRIWTPDLDIVPPIVAEELPSFDKLVNWHGYSDIHTAFDYAAYLRKDGKCVLGLPETTQVRAIADGVVGQVSNGFAGKRAPYAMRIHIEHAEKGSGMFSSYHHVVPYVEKHQPVRKGDVIGTLYKDVGSEEGKLVHLHFEMSNGWWVEPRNVNPEKIFPGIGALRAEPQKALDFGIPILGRDVEIVYSHFKRIKCGRP